MTLFLWDASDFDWGRGSMSLVDAKNDGIVGFTHKATEGTTVKHVHTGEALNRARAAGMEFIGAYHVVRSVNVAAQVAFFLAYLDQVAPWWRTFPGFFLQVDLEKWPYDQVSASTGMQFAAQLKAAQPKWVVTYASRGQYGNTLTGIVTPLWNAAYGTNPIAHYPVPYPGDGSANWAPYSNLVPVFWQYGSRLTIGSQPTCDANAFRGTLNDLRALVTGTPVQSSEDEMIMIRSGATDGSIYLVPGFAAPTGRIAAYGIGSVAEANAYTAQGIKTVQLPGAVTAMYDTAPGPWPTGSGGGGGGPLTISGTISGTFDGTSS